MVRDIPYSEMTGDPASVEGHLVAHATREGKHLLQLWRQRWFPPPSVCSTAVGPPQRTSPPPGRRLPFNANTCSAGR